MGQVTGTSGAALELTDLAGSNSRHRREKLVRNLFFGATLISILISLAIVLSLVGRALTFITNVPLDALWTSGWFPRRDAFDLRTVIVGTFLIAGIGMLVATPLGLGASPTPSTRA